MCQGSNKHAWEGTNKSEMQTRLKKSGEIRALLFVTLSGIQGRKIILFKTAILCIVV
jgi:hypothetical protein